jgi:hypothetical protein
VISATHNHHGPDTAFSVNDEWYEVLADQMADAIYDAATLMEPARLEVVSGDHRFGQSDGRDPLIVDPRLNVLRVVFDGDGDRTIATVVQWASHPETTLGWEPPGDYTEQCAAKGWAADDCSADGRYFGRLPGHRASVCRLRSVARCCPTAPSAVRSGRVTPTCGRSRAAPGRRWHHRPSGAEPVAGASDLRSQNFARTAAIGTQLADQVLRLLDQATALTVDTIDWREQPYFTRLTNIGFRVLLADGSLGWQDPTAYNCSSTPFTDDNCVDDAGALEDDPVLTPLVDSQVRTGDVLKTQISWIGLGEVGFLFMPGELPPELVIGLPTDFESNTAAYYSEPALHAVGAAYEVPGRCSTWCRRPSRSPSVSAATSWATGCRSTRCA